MSVILKHKNKVTIYCKGADNVILARTKKSIKESKECAQLQGHLDTFAKEGLRTLLLAKKELDTKWFEKWQKEYEDARADIDNREKRMEELHEKVEID